MKYTSNLMLSKVIFSSDGKDYDRPNNRPSTNRHNEAVTLPILDDIHIHEFQNSFAKYVWRRGAPK